MKITLDNDTVIRQARAGSTTHKSQASIDKFAEALSKRIPMDTGFLPPGLLAYRQAGRYSQIVLQAPPGVNYVNWGECEGDPEAGPWLLAQPWRLLICDTKDDEMLGCRMFYSPTQISYPDQPLYLANVPNINILGYGGGVGLGWLCLYPVESWKGWTLSEKMARIHERCSGIEAYNDRNMSHVDGTRYYQSQHKPQYTWSRARWEAKSKKEGFEWTLDEELWIPAKVTSIDSQLLQDEAGVPLTVAMACFGTVSCTYNDTDVKTFNTIGRKDIDVGATAYRSIFEDAFVHADHKPLDQKVKA